MEVGVIGLLMVPLGSWHFSSTCKSRRYKCPDAGLGLSKAERVRANTEYVGGKQTPNTRKEQMKKDKNGGRVAET